MGAWKVIVPSLSEEQKAELDELYRKTAVPRVRTRAQMVLCSREKAQVYEIVRLSRKFCHGFALATRYCRRHSGLLDAPRAGRSSSSPLISQAILEVVRRRPRAWSWNIPCGPCNVWQILGRRHCIRVSTKPSDEHLPKKYRV